MYLNNKYLNPTISKCRATVAGVACSLFAMPFAASASHDRLAWVVDAGDYIYSSAAIDTGAGRLVVGAEAPDGEGGRVVALDLSGNTPQTDWVRGLPDWVDASPAIAEDGTVYIGSWDGRLYALDGDTGVEKWSFPTDGLIISSPAIAPDGTVYVASTDFFLYALNPDDGSLKWEFFVGAEMDSSPAVDVNGTVYIGTHDGEMVAIHPGGWEKWRHTIDTGGGTDARILASPAIDVDGAIYFGAGNGWFHALDSQGTLVWKTPFPDAIHASPVIDAGGNIYFATFDGYLYKLDSHGLEIYSIAVGDVLFSAAVLDAAGNVYVVGFSGNNTSTLYAIRAEDGEILWHNDIPAVVDASPTLTPHGKLVVGGFDGNLYGFDAGFGLAAGDWPKFLYSLPNRTYLGEPPGPVGARALFPDMVPLDGGWNYVDWLGYVSTAEFPWLYHPQWKWFYAHGPGVSEHWWYHMEAGWVWTRPGIFPHLYQANPGRWLWLYLEDQTGPWYYLFDTQTWTQHF